MAQSRETLRSGKTVNEAAQNTVIDNMKDFFGIGKE